MYSEFPCALCGADCSGLICPGCDGDLPRLTSTCARCGMPSHISVCIACLVKPPPWDCLVVPYSFAYPIDKIIHAFKYQGALFWGSFLAGEIARHGHMLGIPLPEILIPVPAHPHRLAERGFNQAAELARGIGRALDIPVHTGAVARIGSHPPQVGLSASSRRTNVRGAFEVRSRGPARGRVAIVDDILTTGATAKELTRVLRRAGANQIQVWVIARTPILRGPR